ncbi:FAD-dependent monooxygenase [Albimonas sp. CAU 1670]|uniref:FAD-dependent monooxygenase n=1 Tax=Albimonas sp. CAU 1670 TaxID=3032599 RepID=UPI0023DC1A6C|nr:FAD-dependent monooxygenase [Albimonas sp. CAU 1670]MDF2233489.1 FAD-dependent monooxygenase [Albimonas sp. CAU 1670]
MTRRLQIVVVGAGVAGLACAAALGRAGHFAVVVEQAPALAEVGAGLQLSPNAVRALDWMGAGEAARAAASRPEATELRLHRSGRVVYRMALGRTAETRWGAPYLHMHRADLLRALEGAARASGAEIRLGQRVERAGDVRGGAAVYTDAGVIEGDLVLGADGVRSVLRGNLPGGSKPLFAGHVAWRGLVPAERLPAGLLSPRTTVWMGPRRHLVTYPLREGRLLNFVAVEEQESWTAEGWSTPGDPAALRASFADWGEEVDTMLAAVPETFRWGLFGHRPLRRWSQGRVALVGDAAHPTLPFLAQGAAMALEDAVVLARALSTFEPTAGLEAWERARKPRATRLQKAAARNGRRFHARIAPEQWVKALALGTFARAAPDLAQGLNDWVYRYDPTAAPI